MATIGAIPSPPPKWAEEVFESASIVNSQVMLSRIPESSSQFVFLNGLFMTIGLSYDYTITGAVVTFNSGVLTTGHVTIKYSYS